MYVLLSVIGGEINNHLSANIIFVDKIILYLAKYKSSFPLG